MRMILGCFVLVTLATAQDKPKFVPPPRAVVLERVEPEYTAEARAAGLEGSVVLYVEVNQDGQLETAHVLQGLGMGLDEKAIEAVKHWRFAPGTRDGLPARSQQSIEIAFRLAGTPSWYIRRRYYWVRRNGRLREGEITDPVLSRYVNPSSCRSNEERAVISFEIQKNGTPDKVKAIGSGEDSLSRALEGWVFLPGAQKGKPTVASGVVEMECHATDETAGQSQRVENLDGNTTITKPILIYKVEPKYSEEARQAKLTGLVLLQIEVDETGHAVNMAVIRSLEPSLDEKAMEAVNQWHFRPSTREGKPVPVWAQVEIRFRLL